MVDAVIMGDIKKVRRLLDAGADVNDQSLLPAAMWWLARLKGPNHITIARMIFEKDPDIHFKGNDNRTLLMSAVGDGNTLLAHMLIERGADCSATDDKGHNALFDVVESIYYETQEDIKAARTLLHTLMRKGAAISDDLVEYAKAHLISTKAPTIMLYLDRMNDRRIAREEMLARPAEIATTRPLKLPPPLKLVPKKPKF